MMEILLMNTTRSANPRFAHEINQSVRGIERGREMNAPAYAYGNLPRRDIISAERPQGNGHGANGVTPAVVDVLAKPDKPARLPTPLRNPGRSGQRADSPPATSIRRRWQEALDILSRAMCGVGLHRGDWGYVTEGKCSQIRLCQGCGSIHARTRHRLHWRYDGQRTCAQVRTCSRCNIVPP